MTRWNTLIVNLAFLSLSVFASDQRPALELREQLDEPKQSTALPAESPRGTRELQRFEFSERELPGKLEVTSIGGLVSGSFTGRGYTIYFEAVRGEANDSEDPDTPPYAIDVRILDRNRAPFLVQIAGSTPMTRAWYDEQTTAQLLPIDDDDRRRAFSMSPAAGRALRAYAERNGQVRWELNEIAALLESVTLDDLQNFEEGGASKSVTTLATSYKHKVTIKKKKATGTRGIFEHSAVILQIYRSNGSLLTEVSTSNHGAKATSSTMSTKCSKTFTKPNAQVTMWDFMCDYYGYWYGVVPGLHTCNTDTRQEYLSIKGSSSQNWGICGVPMGYAPNCD